jgi:2-keto-3-deoxy-L-rhamnonate aldolase RhmA
VLDAGAHGVMVPYVSTAAEARAAVQAMRYPPRGMRGVAKLTRASAFGARFDEYFAHAHEWLVTLVQIETEEAVRNAAEIAAVDGVDVVFVGPMDLTTSMGIPGQYGDARFHDALGEVADAALGAGKAAGILLLDPANLPLVRELGYTVVALGSDGGAVAAGLRQSLETLSRART